MNINDLENKQAYLFGTKWGDKGIVYTDKCLQDKVAFIGAEDGLTYQEVAKTIKKGDIIAIRDGERFVACGIAKTGWQLRDAVSGKSLYDSQEEAGEIGGDIIYVEVEEWVKPENEKIDLTGYRGRIIKLENTDKQKEVKSGIINILKKNDE